MKTKMTIEVRRSQDRGHFNFGWLDTYHTFSFAEYHDRQHMHFRALRVINEDTVESGKGFGTHPHSDMEILTYVFEGELQHKDSMGNGSVIHAGEFQRMSAGTGVKHSEFNPSPDKRVRLLQIWIMPAQYDLTPSYEQKTLSQLQEIQPGWRLVADSKGADAILIHQDVKIFHGQFSKGSALSYRYADGRGLWVQLISGKLQVEEEVLEPGDGISVEGGSLINLKAEDSAEFLLFDLAAYSPS